MRGNCIRWLAGRRRAGARARLLYLQFFQFVPGRTPLAATCLRQCVFILRAEKILVLKNGKSVCRVCVYKVADISCELSVFTYSYSYCSCRLCKEEDEQKTLLLPEK